MGYGSFSYRLTALAVLLAADGIALGWAWNAGKPVTFINLLLLWLVLLLVLLYQVKKVNRLVARFFAAFRNQDSTVGFRNNLSGKEFTELTAELHAVLESQSRIKSEKEAANSFFNAVFNHADVGLLVYDREGSIHLINAAARNILGTADPVHIRKLAQEAGTDFPEALRPGDRALIKIRKPAGILHCSVRSRKIITPEQEYTLFSLQNINRELEENELESWQKLIRVFIHEIMNSVTPITITATGIIRLLENGQEERLMADREAMVNGLEAIRKRSRGLAAFMESYRRLTQIPSPEFTVTEAGTLLRNTLTLMQPVLERRGIRSRLECVPSNPRLWGDEKLIEQVMLNLLHNAVDALYGIAAPAISVNCVEAGERITITVEDNGAGIPAGVMDTIFVPFFTTKAEGSGIGLSISRQIMNLHKGSIIARSKPGETVFQLDFPLVP